MQINPKKLVVPALALAALVGCSGVGDGGSVKGKRDDIRQITAVAEKSHKVTKPNKVRECASRKKGKCTRYHTVTRGTKTVKVIDRRSKPAVWCVELDDVNGKRSRDDRWYEVTSATYLKMAGKDEGEKVKFKYLTTGCSQ